MPFTTRASSMLSWLMTACLITCILLISCDTGEDTPPRSDILTDAVLLPKQEGTPEPTQASSYINILSETVSADFPDSITFNLEARSSHEITGIELLYTIRKILRPSVIVSIEPEFETDMHVVANWTWDTRKTVLPPGAELEYSWIVENDAGSMIETDGTSFVFKDDHYDWDELAEGKIRLFWYKGGDSFGEELMENAQQALIKVADNANAELQSQVQIYIYGSNQDLHNALVYPDEWTGGMAFTQHGVIVIGISPNNLEWGKRAITHELSHMVIYQVTYSPLSNVPAWLDEGLAMVAEGEPRPNFELRLESAITNDSLFSIASISGGFPAAYSEAELAYAQSYSLVKLLLDEHGSVKMQQLLQEFSDGISLDEALLNVYGFNSDQLEEHWRSSL